LKATPKSGLEARATVSG